MPEDIFEWSRMQLGWAVIVKDKAAEWFMNGQWRFPETEEMGVWEDILAILRDAQTNCRSGWSLTSKGQITVTTWLSHHPLYSDNPMLSMSNIRARPPASKSTYVHKTANRLSILTYIFTPITPDSHPSNHIMKAPKHSISPIDTDRPISSPQSNYYNRKVYPTLT